MYKSAAALLCIVFSLSVSAQQPRSDNWFSGLWEGTGYQIDNGSTWGIRVSVSGKKYLIDYPSLKCGGEWRLVSMNLQEATFVERIVYGKNNCEDDGNVVIERLNEYQVSFRYSSSNSTEVTSSSILRKKQ